MPQNSAPAEMTVKAVGLGIFLAFVFGSANAYLGMRAGQTVAATIPAAVIAMALFRIPAFRGGPPSAIGGSVGAAAARCMLAKMTWLKVLPRHPPTSQAWSEVSVTPASATGLASGGIWVTVPVPVSMRQTSPVAFPNRSLPPTT